MSKFIDEITAVRKPSNSWMDKVRDRETEKKKKEKKSENVCSSFSFGETEFVP